MTKKASKLINENVIRRWGKLANMPSLTENFLDNLKEEDGLEDEMAAAEDEVAAGEEEMEGGMEAEASVAEQEAVENIVQAVVDAISAETGVDIEVEGGADDEGAMDDMDDTMDDSDELDSLADDEMDASDEDPAMRDMAYNRTDEKMDNKKGGQGYDDEEDEELAADGKESTKKQSFRDRRDEKEGRWGTRDAKNRKDETLDLEVIDDEALTEAVLSRVVERLLKKN